MDRDKDSRKAEEIEIASVAPTEERPVETQEDVILEETDDYFQDPTAISKHYSCVLIILGNVYGHKVYTVFIFVLVPAIEPVSIERFPDYVRDMLQNKESKLKTEFMVSFVISATYVHVDVLCNALKIMGQIYIIRNMWEVHMIILPLSVIADAGKTITATLHSGYFTTQ